VKLAGLERQAASVIEDMHTALPRGTFTLKRRDLELLRKFLFMMHYRNVSCSSNYFQVDHPENADGRQWIEYLMKTKGMQSPVETWLYFLRYYLDTSHSDIMKDAAELIEKYGLEGLRKMLSESQMLPDLERFPAIGYHDQAASFFLSIWEAAEGEEFILTHNAFGLWEGLAGDCPGLHHIFVVSPRIAIILCSTLLRPELKDYIKRGLPLKSSLLNVKPAPATPIYARVDSIRESFKSPRSLERYRSSQEGENDSFVFKITKLSRPQTLELNSVVLLNMKEAGALTFLSKERMLRTARAFRSLPSNFPESNLLVPLIEVLTASTIRPEPPALRPPLQSPTAVPDEDNDALSFVDVVLYVLLMQICTGQRQFPSAYDRAHLVFKIMEKARPTTFAHEVGQEVEKAFRACKRESEDMGSDSESFAEGIRFASLLSSIPSEVSSQLFHVMISYMSKLGAVMSGGEGILQQLQDEVAVVSFLTRASCSPAVWHTLSCSNPQAPEILSKLFKKFGTPADGAVKRVTDFMYEEPPFTSCYDRAYALRGICGMSGPTTNPISGKYYWLTMRMIHVLGYDAMTFSLPAPYSSQPRERPKARLLRKMSKTHSDMLLMNVKMILQRNGFTPSLEDDTKAKAIQKWIDEMAIVNTLAWLGKHRRNFLDFILDGFSPEVGFKLFEEDEDIGST